MRIHIVHVGTIKEKYLTDAVAEYEKRLSAYCVIDNISVKEERLPDKPSPSEISAALTREGERILAALPPRAYTIALCVEGKQMTSEAFSERISTIANEGFSDICLIIGGSDGLSDAVKKSCRMRLSISEMTFPHQLMRVILLEQLYRAFNIAAGGKYHK
ncbi:MAG: 23S rRNA (pseudouridine(1915)-N(3))-methyltransferase RlmH [Ruminococcaceae bacterium]|nr:23S rRNA (pseudouridine(1915)-N(3))-methyltransferase RlmH [Oscillospiraceae bacterium]